MIKKKKKKSWSFYVLCHSIISQMLNICFKDWPWKQCPGRRCKTIKSLILGLEMVRSPPFSLLSERITFIILSGALWIRLGKGPLHTFLSTESLAPATQGQINIILLFASLILTRKGSNIKLWSCQFYVENLCMKHSVVCKAECVCHNLAVITLLCKSFWTAVLLHRGCALRDSEQFSLRNSCLDI